MPLWRGNGAWNRVSAPTVLSAGSVTVRAGYATSERFRCAVAVVTAAAAAAAAAAVAAAAAAAATETWTAAQRHRHSCADLSVDAVDFVDSVAQPWATNLPGYVSVLAVVFSIGLL